MWNRLEISVLNDANSNIINVLKRLNLLYNNKILKNKLYGLIISVVNLYRLLVSYIKSYYLTHT